MVLNPTYFNSYCHPLTVEEHTRKMRNNFVWGTHAEIFSLSLCFRKPVFVGLNKKGHMYYWAKYMCLEEDDKQVVFPPNEIELQSGLHHFEICHVNNCHYDVSLTAAGSIPHIPPYIDDKSTSAADTVCIT